jgi:transcriptional regulator with XRE-family HTH domain
MGKSPMTLISRIDQRLEELGLSGRQACELAELGESYIRDLRRNEHQSPRVDDLKKLAVALKTNIEWLITGAGDPARMTDAPTAEIIGIMPHLDAARRAEAAQFIRYLAEQAKREKPSK